MSRCNPSRRQESATRFSTLFGLGLLGIAGFVFLPASKVEAQVIIATVNGDPITDIDVEERMKLLRAMHLPASHDDALNSMIDDQLKTEVTAKFKIDASDTQIGEQIAREAARMKVAPQAMLAAIENAGVSESNIKDHFAADYKFSLLVQAYNKGIEASEEQVREELAKDGGASAAGIDYKINQVIFTLFENPKPAEIEAKMKAAEQLRSKFSDCDSGLAMARDMDDVAVKEQLTRNSLQISDNLKALLDKTPVGHLTAPERTVDGIEMIAVCSKGVSNDEDALQDAISQKLLDAEFQADGERRLKELRSYAVIVVKK